MNKVEDLNKNVVTLRYKPHESQKLVHQSKARWKIICSGRRFGKSLCCAGDMISRALSGKYNAYDTLAWIAPTNAVCGRGIEAMKLITQECPNLITWYKSAPVTATFPNGVKVVFLSADNPDSLRGLGISHCVIDEADYLMSYLWDSVLRASLSDKQGSMIAISTPRAKNTWFHKLYLQGLSKEFSHIESFHFPSSDNPLMTEDEIEDARMTLPELVFKREYLAEFTDSGGQVFSNIEGCIYKSEKDNCKCNSEVVIGLDVAKSNDWTVLVGICTRCRKIKFIKRFNQIDWSLQKNIIKSVYINAGVATLIIDSTGVGDVIYDDLRSDGLNINPFKFTNQSKQQLINNLRLMIMDNKVSWSEDLENSDILRYELECYEIQETRTGLVTYNGRQGVHDDCVISLALAISGLKSFISPIIFQNEDIKKNPQDFINLNDLNYVDIDRGVDFGDENSVFFE